MKTRDLYGKKRKHSMELILRWSPFDSGTRILRAIGLSGLFMERDIYELQAGLTGQRLICAHDMKEPKLHRFCTEKRWGAVPGRWLIPFRFRVVASCFPAHSRCSLAASEQHFFRQFPLRITCARTAAFSATCGKKRTSGLQLARQFGLTLHDSRRGQPNPTVIVVPRRAKTKCAIRFCRSGSSA